MYSFFIISSMKLGLGYLSKIIYLEHFVEFQNIPWHFKRDLRFHYRAATFDKPEFKVIRLTSRFEDAQNNSFHEISKHIAMLRQTFTLVQSPRRNQIRGN